LQPRKIVRLPASRVELFYRRKKTLSAKKACQISILMFFLSEGHIQS